MSTNKKSYGFVPCPEQVEEIKVTRIGEKYHARLRINGKLFAETVVSQRCNIGAACVELLRQADKMGLSSRRTSASRLNYNGRRPYPISTEKIRWIWPQ